MRLNETRLQAGLKQTFLQERLKNKQVDNMTTLSTAQANSCATPQLVDQVRHYNFLNDLSRLMAGYPLEGKSIVFVAEYGGSSKSPRIEVCAEFPADAVSGLRKVGYWDESPRLGVRAGLDGPLYAVEGIGQLCDVLAAVRE